jgi:anti-sigma factor RsiW
MSTSNDEKFEETARRYLLGTLSEYATIQVTERLETNPELVAMVEAERKALEEKGLLATQSELEEALADELDAEAILSDQSRPIEKSLLPLAAGFLFAVVFGVVVLQML